MILCAYTMINAMVALLLWYWLSFDITLPALDNSGCHDRRDCLRLKIQNLILRVRETAVEKLRHHSL